MEIVITPGYTDLFEGPVPDLQDLLVDIPSKANIALMSLINAQLYLSDDFSNQISIMQFLLRRQSEKTKIGVFQRIERLVSRPKERLNLFTVLFGLEMIHFELIHFRDFHIPDTTPEQELALLKGYFVVAEKANKLYPDPGKMERISDAEYFQRHFWPIVLAQFESTTLLNPMSQIAKGIAVFNHLQYHSPYGQYVETFLRTFGKQTSWNYILDLVNLIQGGWDYDKDQNNLEKRYPYSMKITEDFRSLFHGFCIDPATYRITYSEKANFTGLKERPLFKFSDNHVLVLNWNFLCNKLYDGLLHDFHVHSGIKEQKEVERYIDFKRYLSQNVIEKHLFKHVIENCFSKKHCVIQFDEGSGNGFPDAYVRFGKYVFLFEIKDAYFPTKVISTMSHEKIKEVVDQKYNNPKKGIGQIIKQLKAFAEDQWIFERQTGPNLKKRNLVVYPIIIYTDPLFGLPGVNLYLRNELVRNIYDNGLSTQFGSIKNLCMIDLSFLINNLSALAGGTTLKNWIDTYQETIKAREKRLSKRKSLENLFLTNDNFHTISSRKFKKGVKGMGEDYTRRLFRTFNLDENLPKA